MMYKLNEVESFLINGKLRIQLVSETNFINKKKVTSFMTHSILMVLLMQEQESS